MSVNSIRNLLELANKSCPNKIAIIDKNVKITYGELFEKVNKVAYFLKELNLKKGSRIGIYSNKSLGKIIAILAILSTEYIFVPITRVLKSEQVKHIIDDCGIESIITDSAKIKKLQKIFDGKIISYDKTDEDIVCFEEIFKCYNGDFKCEIKGFESASITYSFATVGLPKGIVMSHRSLIDGARVVSKYLDLKNDDIISGVLSLSLDYGLNQIFSTLYKKATLVLHTFFLPNEFFNHLINDKITVLPLMPINLTMMFDEDSRILPNPQSLKNVRIITSSGGNVTNKMIENMDKFFINAKFFSMHGLSEAFRSAYLNPKQLKIRPTSIGKAIPDVELYVINEKGENCKPREIGELIHRGAGIYKGYWNSPEETSKRFKSIEILDKVVDLDGSLTDEIVVASGDFVYRDEEDYIYFVSRKDDMIKSRGYRISPNEIETVALSSIENIKSCAVFGIENEEIEEEIVLVYQSRSEIAKNEILFELKKHLPNYMLPSILIHKKSLGIGKIDKEKLKKEILN